MTTNALEKKLDLMEDQYPSDQPVSDEVIVKFINDKFDEIFLDKIKQVQRETIGMVVDQFKLMCLKETNVNYERALTNDSVHNIWNYIDNIGLGNRLNDLTIDKILNSI